MAPVPRLHCLCRVSASLAGLDPLLALDQRGSCLSVVLAEERGQMRVVLSAVGQSGLVPPESLSYTLREESVLLVLERLEEAIEDEQEATPVDPGRLRARRDPGAVRALPRGVPRAGGHRGICSAVISPERAPLRGLHLFLAGLAGARYPGQK
jgi:hypothetical protein